MKNVLIVCTANKTRSVLAMYIANKLARERNKQYYFQSAAIAVLGGSIDANVEDILREMNIEADHTPTDIRVFDITKFDEIHVMTTRHKTALLSYYENVYAQEKILVLGIDDPSGKGFDAYLECKERLENFYKEYIV